MAKQIERYMVDLFECLFFYLFIDRSQMNDYTERRVSYEILQKKNV